MSEGGSNQQSGASDLELFSKMLAEFQVRQAANVEKSKSAQAALDSNFKSLDDLVASNSTQFEEFKKLENMLKQIQKDSAETKSSNLGIELVLLAHQEALDEAKLSLEAIKQKKAKTGSIFLAMILGNVNVRLWKKGEVLAFKDEYNRFKKNSAVVYILFPLLQLFYPYRLLTILHQLWLLHYYTALAVRENILQTNGSEIKNWWIVHHYVSMFVSVLTLVWSPSVASYDALIAPFMWFLLFQGGIMMVQNSYQNNRHYVRRSLGKATELDVGSSETISEKPSDLQILVPLLFATYLVELALGVACLLAASSASSASESFPLDGAGLPPALLGLCFASLGVGNAITTVQTLYQKRQKASLIARIRRQKSQ